MSAWIDFKQKEGCGKLCCSDYSKVGIVLTVDFYNTSISYFKLKDCSKKQCQFHVGIWTLDFALLYLWTASIDKGV